MAMIQTVLTYMFISSLPPTEGLQSVGQIESEHIFSRSASIKAGKIHILHCHVTVGTRKRAFHIMGNDHMFTLRILSPKRLEGIRSSV